MKFFDIDWNNIFECLPVWDAMELESRRQFLNPKLAHSQAVQPELYGKDAAMMVEGGLVEPAAKDRLRPTQDKGVTFRRIFMQLLKQPIFEETAGRENLEAYLSKHLTNEDIGALQGRRIGSSISLGSEAWPRSFFENPDPEAWESHRHGWSEPSDRSIYGWRSPDSRKPILHLNRPSIAQGAQALVRMAYESPEPLFLNLLRERAIPGLKQKENAAAFLAAVRYGLIFPGLLPDSLEAVFWIWPAAGRRLHRKPEPAPYAVEAEEIACPPYLLEDCTIVLARAITAPLLTKRLYFHTLYDKVAAEILSRFSPLTDLVDVKITRRLDAAIGVLTDNELLKVIVRPQQCLTVTSVGKEWMQATPGERLQVFLKKYRKKRNPPKTRYTVDRSTVNQFLPWIFYKKLDHHHYQALQAADWVEGVWTAADEGKFYRLEEWMRYHSRDFSAAGLAPEDGVSKDPYYGIHTAEEIAHEWLEQVLRDFFHSRLVPLGCVRLGRASDGATCFAINPTGCFFLSGGGTVTSPAVTNGEVLINPDFDIIFLGSNVLAEAELSVMAEICGAAPGVVLRITKTSVLKAIEAGNPADQLLDLLKKHSSKPLPTNVRSQIQGWAASCKRVDVSNVTLLTCPDDVVANRILLLLGAHCTLVTPEILALPQGKIDPKLRKRLQKEGIFFSA